METCKIHPCIHALCFVCTGFLNSCEEKYGQFGPAISGLLWQCVDCPNLFFTMLANINLMLLMCCLSNPGAVIKAWDLGVATMKRGELAVLLCKSEYAYGKSGSPPNIPPDATLVFEVELFDWKGRCRSLVLLLSYLQLWL